MCSSCGVNAGITWIEWAGTWVESLDSSGDAIWKTTHKINICDHCWSYVGKPWRV